MLAVTSKPVEISMLIKYRISELGRIIASSCKDPVDRVLVRRVLPFSYWDITATLVIDYIRPLMQKVISVFGSSRCGESDDDYRIAMELGGALARAGFAVASGGYGGAMEAVSRGAAEAGGRVIGVVASAFSSKANRWVGETIVVPKWEDRLWKLISLGDGYVALPGGTGTLVELAVAWEMIHKCVMPAKPLVALGEFWRPIVAQIESADGNSRGMVRLAATPADAVAALTAQLG